MTTHEFNLKILDLYKRVDNFIIQAYQTEKGVTEYLNRMKKYDDIGMMYVKTWKADYGKLDHIRWARNQFDHNVSYETKLLDMSDYNWLDSFHKSLYASTDPLAVVNKTDAYKKQKQTEERIRRMMEERELQKQTAQTRTYTPAPQPQYRPQKESFWQRLKYLFTGK